MVVPAYNEGIAIVACLDRIFAATSPATEVLVVYDRPDDSTAGPVRDYVLRQPRARGVLNDVKAGPAGALKAGFRAACAPVVVVTMADGSDDVTQIPELVSLVRSGAVIAAASRYMRGGHQDGGPRLKRLMSRTAGVSLHLFAQVGTHDATNAFKAYSRAFVEEVGIESDSGFEVAIELVAKARRHRLTVREIPTTWSDRATGSSNFKIWKWTPHYLNWYVVALRAGLPRGRWR